MGDQMPWRCGSRDGRGRELTQTRWSACRPSPCGMHPLLDVPRTPSQSSRLLRARILAWLRCHFAGEGDRNAPESLGPFAAGTSSARGLDGSRARLQYLARRVVASADPGAPGARGVSSPDMARSTTPSGMLQLSRCTEPVFGPSTLARTRSSSLLGKCLSMTSPDSLAGRSCASRLFVAVSGCGSR